MRLSGVKHINTKGMENLIKKTWVLPDKPTHQKVLLNFFLIYSVWLFISRLLYKIHGKTMIKMCQEILVRDFIWNDLFVREENVCVE